MPCSHLYICACHLYVFAASNSHIGASSYLLSLSLICWSSYLHILSFSFPHSLLLSHFHILDLSTFSFLMSWTSYIHLWLSSCSLSDHPSSSLASFRKLADEDTLGGRWVATSLAALIIDSDIQGFSHHKSCSATSHTLFLDKTQKLAVWESQSACHFILPRREI